GRGYVMRRILRRASRFGRTLDLHEPFLHKLVDVLAKNMGQAFEELNERREFVARVIESEETSFGRTLDRGLEIFAAAAEKSDSSGNKTISGEDAFKLYDTYGFPLDLTQLMAREQGLKVDTDGFDRLMDQQRQQARAAQKTGSLTASISGMQLPQTDDLLKYQTDSCTARVIGWIDGQGLHTQGQIGQTAEPVGLILDRTCFYAESGGQVGDSGQIWGQAGGFAVEMTEKVADCVIHQGKLKQFVPQDGFYVYFRYTDKDAVMVVINKNKEAKNLDLVRFREVLKDYKEGKDIVSGTKFILENNLTIPAETALVLDLN
ncbi:MAG: hypothetical protein HGA23_05425, partial [Bacteroidales bacterium]|nr:hypothetical protein [Bacteroidales bacterium]